MNVYFQQCCQITGSWKSLTWRDEVDLSNYIHSWNVILLLNITTENSPADLSTIQVLFNAVGVFWKYEALKIKVALSQRSWFFSLTQWMKEESSRCLITALTQGSRTMANGLALTSGEFVLLQLKWTSSDMCRGALRSRKTCSPTNFIVMISSNLVTLQWYSRYVSYLAQLWRISLLIMCSVAYLLIIFIILTAHIPYHDFQDRKTKTVRQFTLIFTRLWIHFFALYKIHSVLMQL